VGGVSGEIVEIAQLQQLAENIEKSIEYLNEKLAFIQTLMSVGSADFEEYKRIINRLKTLRERRMKIIEEANVLREQIRPIRERLIALAEEKRLIESEIKEEAARLKANKVSVVLKTLQSLEKQLSSINK